MCVVVGPVYINYVCSKTSVEVCIVSLSASLVKNQFTDILLLAISTEFSSSKPMSNSLSMGNTTVKKAFSPIPLVWRWVDHYNHLPVHDAPSCLFSSSRQNPSSIGKSRQKIGSIPPIHARLGATSEYENFIVFVTLTCLTFTEKHNVLEFVF